MRTALLPLLFAAAFAQSADLPTPYRTLHDWGELPSGMKWAAVTGVEPDSTGGIFVIHRCFENSCAP
jgi:hypothetical protein